MDSQLEVCRRRSLPIPRLCDGTSYHESQSPWKFPHYPLDTTIRSLCHEPDFHALQTTAAQGSATDLPPRYSDLYHDNYFELPDYRTIMRAKSALPILCIHSVVYTVLTVEIRAPPNPDICGLGSAGMGMERISKYEHQLHGCCRMSSHSSGRHLVGHAQRFS